MESKYDSVGAWIRSRAFGAGSRRCRRIWMRRASVGLLPPKPCPLTVAPQVAVPDNVKAAVKKPSRYEPILNETYADLLEHWMKLTCYFG